MYQSNCEERSNPTKLLNLCARVSEIASFLAMTKNKKYAKLTRKQKNNPL